MDRSEIIERVKKTAVEVMRNCQLENLELETRLREDMGLDSLEAMSLIIALEEEFSIVIADDQAQNLGTIDSVVRLIEECLAEATVKRTT